MLTMELVYEANQQCREAIQVALNGGLMFSWNRVKGIAQFVEEAMV